MARTERVEKKRIYFDKLINLFQTYPKVLIVHADHVGSRQMADIRVALRGKAVLLMGKNTTIRTAFRQNFDRIPQLEKLLPYVKSNIGFIFCICDPSEVRQIVAENRVPAPAKVGVLAPKDVYIPAGPTGMDPGSTSFFQALGISTKIVKGQIEIQSDVQVVKEGEKVTASAAALLQKLSIKPFSYGLSMLYMYDDGSVFEAAVLDMNDDTILNMFNNSVRNIAAFSRQIGIPTQASMPHCLLEGFKHCTALVLQSDYVFPQMATIKEYILDPSKFASLANSAKPVDNAAAATKAPVKPEEPEEESDEEMGFSLFD